MTAGLEEVIVDGFAIPINPSSISWDFSLKTSSSKTIGGKVIQVYGVKLGDLRMSGRMAQADFMLLYNKMLSIAERQVPTQASPTAQPVQLTWSSRNWSFYVYLKGFKQTDAQASVKAANESFAPEWEATFFIADENADIVNVAKEAAQAAYIRRISQGLGWTQTSWNGPMGVDDLQAILKGQTLQQFLFNRWGEVNQQTGIVPKESK